MSKKSGKKKNKKKANGEIIKKLFTKKNIIYTVSTLCAILVIIGICIGVKIVRKRKADRTVRIAFYGLSEDLTGMIKEKIPVEEEVILDFDVIPEGNLDLRILKSKYDMLFTWRGEVTDSLAPASEDIPQKILETMPNSLRNKKCVPIVLDHCEMAFSKDVLSKLKGDIPSTYTGLNDFLYAAKDYVFSPFFCNGADNRIFIDFIGALVMGKGGLTAYNKLIEELRKAESLDDVIDVNLDGKGCTVRSILDMLKNWPKEGLTHPAWYNGIGNDLLFFAQDKQLACFFTLLTEHRKIPYNVIKNFDSSFVPAEQLGNNYGLIAPAVSCMLLSDNSNCKRYLAGFFTEAAQTEFSNKTNLAPVHYRAESYDRQADDVRFWAASCEGGAVPDLYLACFQRDSKKLDKICTEIRNYVR